MDYIKVAKVNNVILHRRGQSVEGTLHLTTHHLIFTGRGLAREFWVSYPTIGAVFKNRGSALISKQRSGEGVAESLYWDKDIWSVAQIKVVGKDYTVFSLDFAVEASAQDVFESLLHLTVLHQVSQLYAFIYLPNRVEAPFDSWKLYKPLEEYARQGLTLDRGSPWRSTAINDNYQFCATYPAVLVVPASISDTLLTHASKYRSQNRIPVLTYYYKKTGASITRSAQPLPGLTQQRSIQDEKLVYEAFQCAPEKTKKDLIVDARPATNAMAQTALGGGTENMDNYGFGSTCSRMFLGIDNIHVMRDTLNFLVENFLVDNDLNLPIDAHSLNSGKASNWLKYIKVLLSATDTLVKSIIFNKSNILVHCSDGWDRTAQVCSLVQLCLDPYYRTFEGFMVLVEKDWLSFGHRFAERCGHLSSEYIFRDNSINRINLTSNSVQLADNETIDQSLSTNDLVVRKSSFIRKKTNLKLTSPIFQQFLDCVYQLLLQNPEQFEFNERFLRRLVYHLYSCQYGTFIFDNEQERVLREASKVTRSVWDYFRSRPREFTNPAYKPVGPDEEEDWLLPDLNKLQWWWQLFGRRQHEFSDAGSSPNTQGTSNAMSAAASENGKNIYKLTSKLTTFSLEIFGKK
ncbi:ABR152Cp [Eremothecium gossypii ATCC 10895]|uniref:ABR152Cp n=1 Tax=Eremothecium gossypii (strain ATCC 10895 / CBS 109.51 / FGSC 9923 / NRRL Y-1056) TaxID=284811 RepID=Q75D71_EREGS|nr:ABR152Cp [Eremothecium gossypii ATCC 10895]AAS50924.2 ABR152Cp [Eremothecium gossypii ATCC 10895]AEY95213.1 FABR152Cp [Eremothecium gossypii FDAG1]